MKFMIEIFYLTLFGGISTIHSIKYDWICKSVENNHTHQMYLNFKKMSFLKEPESVSSYELYYTRTLFKHVSNTSLTMMSLNNLIFGDNRRGISYVVTGNICYYDDDVYE